MPSIDIDKLKGLASNLKRTPTDVLGLDVGTSGTKAVRMKQTGDGPAFVSAAILPAIALPQSSGDAVAGVPALELPADLTARHAAIAVTGINSVVKLLSFPARGDIEEEIESKIIDSIGVENPDDYRIGYKVVSEGRGKAEARALIAAEPDAEAAAACMLFPAGLPVPHSVEIAGLAAVSAFLAGPAADNADDAIGMVEFGARVSFFTMFLKSTPVLMRKFDAGSDLILEKVQESLGVDRTTAQGILADGSFDISQQISEVMDGFVKQSIVSRDFVERREHCRVSKVFVSGGVTTSRDWMLEMKSAFGFDMDTWNPFDLLKMDGHEFPSELAGHEARFSAAIGAGLATLAGKDA